VEASRRHRKDSEDSQWARFSAHASISTTPLAAFRATPGTVGANAALKQELIVNRMS